MIQRLLSLGLPLLLCACPADKREEPKGPKPAPVDAGKKWAALIVKAGDGQMVRTKDGFWLKAYSGMKPSEAIEVHTGPAAAAERAFVRSFVDPPPCALDLSFESAGLDTSAGWHDKLIVRCGSKWEGLIYFDIEKLIQKQADQLKLIDERERPEAMGLDKQDPATSPKLP